ncbi:helix-turn-helix domain-containing protein [Mesorhizobium sp. M0060]|uniref:helix-turn-helix domain-containing protein n=1 Tax=Mesorhizobium sp. M0060 TaxID=2956866 RepID=UPI0033389450
MNFPKVYTPAMLADRWACSERHVRNMIASVELPAFRLAGKLLRIRGEDVENFECQDQISGEPPCFDENLPPSGTKEPAAHVRPLEPTIRKRRPPAPRLDRR